jgi:hypothetical protein
MRPPIPIPTPKHISERVLKLCKAVVPDQQPVFVQAKPEAYSLPEECHENVAKKISRDGGTVQYGWAIWEVPPWQIFAEFHAIWRSPQGLLLDLSPPLHGGSIVLFLPDPKRVFDGHNISGVHHPYSDSPMCREFVAAVEAHERFLYPPGQPVSREMTCVISEYEAVTKGITDVFVKYASQAI